METDSNNPQQQQQAMKDSVKDLKDRPFLARSASATQDPGVLGPIVWDMKRKQAKEGNKNFLWNIQKNQSVQLHAVEHWK